MMSIDTVTSSQASEALNDLRAYLEESASAAAATPSEESNNTEEILKCISTISELIAIHGHSLRKIVVLEWEGCQAVMEGWQFYCNPSGDLDELILTPEADLIRDAVLNAMYVLTAGLPESVTESTFLMITQVLHNPSVMSDSTKIAALKCLKTIWKGSEKNRELFANDYQIVEPFVYLIKEQEHGSPTGELVREWCGALREFVVNDDRRIGLNRSVERKRLVYQADCHIQFAHFMSTFMDIPTLNALLNALAIMSSDPDFIGGVEAAGGLKGLVHLLESYNFNVLLMKNTISCLRTICMSPTMRAKCAEKTIMVKEVMNLAWANRTDEYFIEVSLDCLAFMTHASPTGCEQLVTFLLEHETTNTADSLLIELMRIFSENIYILKSGLKILRNVAASAFASATTPITPFSDVVATANEGGDENSVPSKITAVIGSDIESFTQELAAKHPGLLGSTINPLLRELGLKLITLTSTSTYGTEESSAGGAAGNEMEGRKVSTGT